MKAARVVASAELLQTKVIELEDIVERISVEWDEGRRERDLALSSS